MRGGQDLRRRDGRGRSEVSAGTSRRLIAAVGADLVKTGI